LRNDDQVIYVSTPLLKMAIVNNTNSIKEGKRRHNLSQLTSKLLGRALSISSLMASFLTEEQKVILHWKAQGNIKELFAEACHTGNLRGYLSSPEYDAPPTAPLGIGMRVGSLEVKHILDIGKKPISNTVHIAKADIVSDIENYFTHVHGLPVYVHLDTVVQKEIMFSGGILIQPNHVENTDLSDAETKNLISGARDRIEKLIPLRDLIINEKKSVKEIFHYYFPDVEDIKMERKLVNFFCTCSKQIFEIKFSQLSIEELLSLKNLKETDASCHFCSTKYQFSEKDIDNIINFKKLMKE